jgi:hypothetical protein
LKLSKIPKHMSIQFTLEFLPWICMQLYVLTYFGFGFNWIILYLCNFWTTCKLLGEVISISKGWIYSQLLYFYNEVTRINVEGKYDLSLLIRINPGLNSLVHCVYIFVRRIIHKLVFLSYCCIYAHLKFCLVFYIM